MKRKSPGINSFADLMGRCFVDEEGHWHWRGAFTVQEGGYRIASAWSPQLQRTVSLPKLIGILDGRPIPQGNIWYRTCAHFDCARPSCHKLGTRSDSARLSRPKNSMLHNARISAARRKAVGKPPVPFGASIFNLGA
jgi:hypothetical protein